MLPFILAAAVATAQPSACPTDLLVADPRIKVVRAREREFDNEIVSIDVKNVGTASQKPDVRQHLDLFVGGQLAGTQPIPAVAAQDSYEAAFRLQVKHVKHRAPQQMTFRFAVDAKMLPGENCTTANDKLTATL